MEVDLALLADAATIDGSGKLNILGIFDRLTTSAFPTRHPRLSEALLPRLQGDLSLYTLEDLRAVQVGVEAIVEHLREEMESTVLAMHPADEGAVTAYFAFAHAITVSARVRELAEEMEAIIELVTGTAPSHESVRTFRFPD
jgi:hypothetical protein